MKKYILLFSILLTGFTLWFYTTHPLASTLTIRGKTFFTELALTNKEKENGLSFRKNLPENQGMLFVYDHTDRYTYSMRGMQFPLDFIWIFGNTIVDITKNVPPTKDNMIPIVSPNIPVDKVFEVQGGTTDKYGITVGDNVIFNK